MNKVKRATRAADTLQQRYAWLAVPVAVWKKFGDDQAGNQAATTGDNYVRITVFLAAVLFLVGIGSSFKLTGVRYALVGFGSVLLILSIVLILQQPGLPS